MSNSRHHQFDILNSVPTNQEFIEKWPLYTRAEIKDFSPPGSITRMCDRCERETTWSVSGVHDGSCQTRPETRFSFVGYTCVLCRNNSLLVLYQNLDWKEDKTFPGTSMKKPWAHFAVKKIGQLPPQSIDVDAELQRRLGSTVRYYKEAMVCRNHGLGIAAVGYMRRVIQDKTDELIDVVIELAQAQNADARAIEELEKLKTRAVRYEDKLQVASEQIPETMKPGGVNPLGQLYVHLSTGVHDKTDDECLAIFDDLQADFEHVFRNLHVQAAQQREFAERVKNRAGKKP